MVFGSRCTQISAAQLLGQLTGNGSQVIAFALADPHPCSGSLILNFEIKVLLHKRIQEDGGHFLSV